MSQHVGFIKGKHSFTFLYLASFALAFHLFFVVYMNSSFLSTFIDEKFVGTIYMVSSLLGIFSLLFISKILRKFGNYNTLVLLTLFEFLAFMGLAFGGHAYIVIPLFVAYNVIFPMMLFNIDVFLEGLTGQENEGTVRGTFLTVVNIALILAPLLAGLLLTDTDYWKIYFVSAIFLVPFLLFLRKLKNIPDPEFHDLQIWNTLTCIKGRQNLYSIFMAQFLLRFFFSWMVIYMPIYLHSHLGFTWSEIGVMTAIMLLPYILIEYPAGRIADKWLGEKELLIFGFIVTALFTGFIPFAPAAATIVLWTVLMFANRAGASFIEIMTESYFFKHVEASDYTTISFFRITRPVAYVLGPLAGTIALGFVSIQYIWLILAVILLIGVYYSMKIEDTK